MWQRSGIHKRFFLSYVFGEHQREILDILSQETERDLCSISYSTRARVKRSCISYARISPGTVNWHMKRLISSGLIEVHRDAQLVKYSLKGESSEILNLIRSYHPTLWQSWVDRIADAISDVTQADNEYAKTQSVDLEKSVDEDGF